MEKINRVVSFLRKFLPDTPEDALLCTVLVKIAQVGSYNRLSVRSIHVMNEYKTALCNMYLMTFMPSGIGKDSMLNILNDNLLERIDSDMTSRMLEYEIAHNARVQEQAAKNYGEKSSAAKTDFINQNQFRLFNLEFGKATMEGFTDERQALAQAGFGGTFLRVSEFGKFLSAMDSVKEGFVEALYEVFDHGNLGSKLIKSERRTLPTRGVPSNAVMHTSIANLMEGKGREKLLSFLNDGLARRSFICYPEIGYKESTLTIEEQYMREAKDSEEAREMIPELRAYFEDLYSHTKAEPQITNNYKSRTYVYDDEADKEIALYNIKNRRALQRAIRDGNDGTVELEINSRFWKTFKLAGIIAAFEHPSKKTVTKEDVIHAIAFTERMGSHLGRFLDVKPELDASKLATYLEKERGKWLKKTDIYKQKFVNQNSFPRWYADNLPLATEMLAQKGLVLTERKGRHNTQEVRVLSSLELQEEQIEEKIRILEDAGVGGPELSLLQRQKNYAAQRNSKSTVDKQ